MKAVPLKLSYIKVPIHKCKPSLPKLNIFLITSRIHITRKISIHAFTMFQPTQKLTFIHVTIRVVVRTVAVHQVVVKIALVHWAVWELVYALAGHCVVVQLAFVDLGLDGAWGELFVVPCALQQETDWVAEVPAW